MITILNAILTINPNAKVNITGSDIDTCKIEWVSGTVEISKSDIEAKQAELQVEYDANKYQRDRAIAYPPIGDQLDMQYWDKVNGTSTWQDTVQAVKVKYPKS